MVGGPVPGVFDTTQLCHRVVIKDATFLNLTLFVYYIVVYPQRFFSVFLLLFFRKIDTLVHRETERDREKDLKRQRGRENRNTYVYLLTHVHDIPYSYA